MTTVLSKQPTQLSRSPKIIISRNYSVKQSENCQLSNDLKTISKKINHQSKSTEFTFGFANLFRIAEPVFRNNEFCRWNFNFILKKFPSQGPLSHTSSMEPCKYKVNTHYILTCKFCTLYFPLSIHWNSVNRLCLVLCVILLH